MRPKSPYGQCFIWLALQAMQMCGQFGVGNLLCEGLPRMRVPRPLRRPRGCRECACRGCCFICTGVNAAYGLVSCSGCMRIVRAHMDSDAIRCLEQIMQGIATANPVSNCISIPCVVSEARNTRNDARSRYSARPGAHISTACVVFVVSRLRA